MAGGQDHRLEQILLIVDALADRVSDTGASLQAGCRLCVMLCAPGCAGGGGAGKGGGRIILVWSTHGKGTMTLAHKMRVDIVDHE